MSSKSDACGNDLLWYFFLFGEGESENYDVGVISLVLSPLVSPPGGGGLVEDTQGWIDTTQVSG